MTGKRARAVAAAAIWSFTGITSASDGATARVLAENAFVYDGETTYCWGVQASVSSSNVTDDLIILRGSKNECPLQLQLIIDSDRPTITTGESVSITWTVANKPSNKALFSVSNAPQPIDIRSGRRASIVHSNLHTCLFRSGCDAFMRGKIDTNTTENQIGNVSESVSTFHSSDIQFFKPGRHAVLAHIIVPGSSANGRYDFAVFATVDVVSGATTEASVNNNGAGASASHEQGSSSSSGHALSTSQIIILAVVGALLVALLVLVMAYSFVKRRQHLCGGKWEDEDHEVRAKHSPNLRTRSSDWTELYAVEDVLPSSVTVDDRNTIAILRSSRASTPTESPTSFHERMVADFRHDVARWDVRSSASPITPSSHAILLATIQDPTSSLSSTPANDCFVPLESLKRTSSTPQKPREAVPSRWTQRIRSASRGRKFSRKAQTPEDSGDEQEVDI